MDAALVLSFHDRAQANIQRAGYKDIPPGLLGLFADCAPYTMTTVERMYALHRAVESVVANKIQGAIVEAGVWRGGSMMVAAYALMAMGVHGRDLWLYDTFTGQPKPDEVDRDIWGQSCLDGWARHVVDGEYQGARATEADVRANLKSTGYRGSTRSPAWSRTRWLRWRRPRSRCCASTRTGTAR